MPIRSFPTKSSARRPACRRATSSDRDVRWLVDVDPDRRRKVMWDWGGGAHVALGKHRAVYCCRLSLRESSLFRIFRGAKGDSYFPHDAKQRPGPVRPWGGLENTRAELIVSAAAGRLLRGPARRWRVRWAWLRLGGFDLRLLAYVPRW